MRPHRDQARCRGPSSSTAISTPAPSRRAVTRTRSPCAAALSIRLARHRFKSVRPRQNGKIIVEIELDVCAAAGREGAAVSCTSAATLTETRRLGGLAADEGEVFVDRAFHIGEVFARRLQFRRRRHHRKLQPKPGDRRAQVVADAGEQLGALIDEAGDALGHRLEALAGAAHFARAAYAQVLVRHILAEALHRLRKVFNRADLIADECDRYGQQQRGRADDPHDEERPRARLYPVALGFHHQHALIDRHADFDLRAIAGRVIEDVAVEASCRLSIM